MFHGPVDCCLTTVILMLVAGFLALLLYRMYRWAKQ